jgi:Tol biopolymer transport system component
MRILLTKLLILILATVPVVLVFARSSVFSQMETGQGLLLFSGDGGLGILNLDTGEYSVSKFTVYQDVAYVTPIDEERVRIWACLVQELMCSAAINEIAAPEDLSVIINFETFKEWQRNYRSPGWSPDRRHLAFVAVDWTSSPGYILGDIFVMDADGSHLIDLTPNETNIGRAYSWSPDSQKIAFACRGQTALCVTHLESGDLQETFISENGMVHELIWSPDGRQIAFTLLDSDYRNSELYVVNADGSNLHRLLEAGSDSHAHPLWSPDGSKIVFRAGEQNNNVGEIYVIEPDGENLVNLTKNLNGNEFGAVWSPDSGSIAFFSARDTGNFLYTIRIDGTKLQKIRDKAWMDATDVGAPDLFWLP